MGKSSEAEKVARGRAGELRVASELCRRGYCATVTMGNTPDTDVICVNQSWTKTVFLQVKTFRAGTKECQVGKRAEVNFGMNFFWVLVGLRDVDETAVEEFYIIPSNEMSNKVHALTKRWLDAPGKRVKTRTDSGIRKVRFDDIGKRGEYTYDVREFKNRWDLLEKALAETERK